MEFDRVIDRNGTYCTQWDYVQDRFGVADLLPFTISDTDFALPEAVVDVLSQRLKHPVFGYTRWNHGYFKSSVQNWYQKRFNFELDSDWIFYSPAVIYSISKLLQIVSKEGSGVVVQTPAYDAFFKTIEGNQRVIVENKLCYQDQRYTIDFEDLEEKLSDPNNQVMLLCSPHNPTGRVWTTEELAKISQLCKQYDVFLISDEIHMDVLRKGEKHHPILEFATEKVALVTSASKTFNFPGLIFSYLLIPDPLLREEFQMALKNQDGLSSTSTLGMLATVAAYNECETWVDELNDYMDENFNYVDDYLKAYLPQLKAVPSQATYLMWIDTKELGIPMAELQEKLVHKGKVAIMDGNVYGGNGSQFLRLNIGCPRAKLEDGLARLKKSLS